MSFSEILGIIGFFLSAILSIKAIANMFTRIKISDAEVRVFQSPGKDRDVIYFDLTLTNMSEFPVSVTSISFNLVGGDFPALQHRSLILSRKTSENSKKLSYAVSSTPLPIHLPPKLSSRCRLAIHRPRTESLRSHLDVLIPESIEHPLGEELDTAYSGAIPWISVRATMNTSRQTATVNFEAKVHSISDSISSAEIEHYLAHLA